jgi:dTMP kinase
MTSSDGSTGRFIVFEGLDGSGTTTQMSLLADAIRARGIDVHTTQEPTDGPLGSVLRDAIEGQIALDPISLALAFAADRTHHLFSEHNGIVQRLQRGKWVLCDRYMISALVYQSGSGVDESFIREINRHAREPDLTIYLDTPPDVCAKRILARDGHHGVFHSMERLLADHRRFLSFAHADGLGPIVTIDGNRPAERVSLDAQAAVEGSILGDKPPDERTVAPRLIRLKPPRTEPGQTRLRR